MKLEDIATVLDLDNYRARLRATLAATEATSSGPVRVLVNHHPIELSADLRHAIRVQLNVELYRVEARLRDLGVKLPE